MKKFKIHQEKATLKLDKTIKKKVKKHFQEQYKTLKISGKDLTQIKALVDIAKQEYALARNRYHRIKVQTKRKRIRPAIKQAFNQSRSEFKSTYLTQDEDLAKLNSARMRYQQGYSSMQTGKVIGRQIGQTGKQVGKTSYHVANRSYNYIRGNGFVKTPRAQAWYTKMMERIRANRVYKAYDKLRAGKRKIQPVTKALTSPFRRFVRNPFSLANIIILVMFIALLNTLFSTHVYVQTEFDMTDTWEYFTKVDREKSNSNVAYYSDIDDMLFYINFNFDKVAKSSRLNINASLPEDFTAVEWLNQFWIDLNGDYNNLKSVSDLYKSSDEKYQKYKMSDSKVKAYEDILELTKETGKYLLMQELKNFLVVGEDAEKSTLTVLRRHGYTSKDVLNATTTFKASAGAFVYAPLPGTVSIVDNQLIIVDGDDTKGRRVTFYDLTNIRVSNGQTIKTGEIIGQVKESSNIDVKFEKPQTKLVAVTTPTPDEEEVVIRELEQDTSSPEALEQQTYEYQTTWKSLNIGFYLPNVQYTQTTTVIQNITADSSKQQRARAFANKIKALIPNATNEGISAILGNFDIESGINPKRAEGDHLNPPIGPTDDSSYDNDEWLGMSGPEIYNGRYANILDRGIGLGQWTNTSDGSTRHTMLRNYANSKGQKWYDLDLQIDFMINGDSPYYKEVFISVVTSSESVEVLTEQFLRKWEGNPGDKVEKRTASAKAWLSYLTTSVTAGQPLANMQDVIMVSPFNKFRSLTFQNGRYSQDTHKGVDLVYKDGRSHQPIFAVDDGEVVRAGVLTGAGNGVVVKHANYYSYYYHLSAITVSHGQQITAGTQVGNMGNTGERTTGEHLHLGFSRAYFDDYFDPEPSLNLSK